MEAYALTYNYLDYQNGGRSSYVYLFRTYKGALAKKESIECEWNIDESDNKGDYYLDIETHTISPDDLMFVVGRI
jgi:hypothetical protein